MERGWRPPRRKVGQSSWQASGPPILMVAGFFRSPFSRFDPLRIGKIAGGAIRGRPAARRLCPKSLQKLVGSGPQGGGHKPRALAHGYSPFTPSGFQTNPPLIVAEASVSTAAATLDSRPSARSGQAFRGDLSRGFMSGPAPMLCIGVTAATRFAIGRHKYGRLVE
jgi:hypothetical protein